MFDFLQAWLYVLLRGGSGGRVLTNINYAPWFGGAATVDRATAVETAGPSWVFLRKTRMNEVPLAVVGGLARAYGCRLENDRYVVLARGAGGRPSPFFDAVFKPLADGAVEEGAAGAPGMFAAEDSTATDNTVARAAVISTYNRPRGLKRTLPQVAALGVPVVVVDDGSAPEARAENRALAEAEGADYLLLPQNRGIAAAINAGVAYWLADPAITWISYFQDDVDVDPALFTVLATYEDARSRPALTGFDTNEHPATRTETDGDRELKYKNSSTGMHLHCHREYWAAVLPIPSRYLGAPKAGRGGSGADAWIVKRAPAALAQRGLDLLCVPGLVTTFAWRAEDSTWGNQHLLDSPTAPEERR